MMRPALALILAASIGMLTMAACGSDSAVTTTDASPDSTPIPDAAPAADAAASLGVGTACPNNTPCPIGLLCLNDNQSQGNFPPEGYCTSLCTTDEQCGLDAFCQDLSGTSLCIARCTATVCQDDAHACVDTSIFIPGGGDACFPGDRTASDGDPCQNTFGQCNDNSFCTIDPFETPNGYCNTVGCTVGDDSACHGGTCVDPGNGQPACALGCTVGNSTPCRTAEGYTCVDVFGSGPGQPGLCLFPTSTGDACGTDTDCAPAAANSDWQCLTGSSFPGGYCGATLCNLNPMQGQSNGCSSDAECHDPDPNTADDQFCVLGCTITADCRDGDGYTCQLVDPADVNGPSGCILP